jgi:hypothetical protein
MKKTILTFGLISGAILGGVTAIMVPLCMDGTMSFDHAEIFGYTVQVLSFLLVFFGIRSYREEAGGAISFGKAFQVGILVTLVACAMYVVSWEIVYYRFVPDFGDRYAARVLEKMKEKGESAEKIAKTTKDMAAFKEMYKNPAINAGITFMEVFPVGLAVTLLSAAILRRKTPPSVPA